MCASGTQGEPSLEVGAGEPQSMQVGIKAQAWMRSPGRQRREEKRAQSREL